VIRAHWLTSLSPKEYVVVRNAGGRAEPAVRDIVVLSTMANITDVVIVHHVGQYGASESLRS
jgi:carbonic anhydrase